MDCKGRKVEWFFESLLTLVVLGLFTIHKSLGFFYVWCRFLSAPTSFHEGRHDLEEGGPWEGNEGAGFFVLCLLCWLHH